MDNPDGSRNNKRLTFSDAKGIARMWEDLLTQPCAIIAILQNILEIRLDDVQRALCLDLRH